jgi:ketosteroid isomerase-like protein
MKLSSLASAAALLLTLPAAIHAQTEAELDAYWATVSRTVAEGDFAGYAALYHVDAVLVSEASRNSSSIRQALDGWKQGFADTREGRMSAGVEFRLTQRLHDAATAHETGIFRYFSKTPTGQESVAMIHFRGLLVKKAGVWLMMMEYQGAPATDAEWAAAAMGGPHSF